MWKNWGTKLHIRLRGNFGTQILLAENFCFPILLPERIMVRVRYLAHNRRRVLYVKSFDPNSMRILLRIVISKFPLQIFRCEKKGLPGVARERFKILMLPRMVLTRREPSDPSETRWPVRNPAARQKPGDPSKTRRHIRNRMTHQKPGAPLETRCPIRNPVPVRNPAACQNPRSSSGTHQKPRDPLETQWPIKNPDSVEPGVNPADRSRDPVYVVARLKLCPCTNFGWIWPLTRWEPGGTRSTGSGHGLCCSPCQTMPVYQFWLNLAYDPVGTRWNPEGPGRDTAYVVARVKLCPCTNFGVIWPLTRWWPGGTRRTGFGTRPML